MHICRYGQYLVQLHSIAIWLLMQVWALSNTFLCSVENDLLFKFTLYVYADYNFISILQHTANKHVVMCGILMYNWWA